MRAALAPAAGGFGAARELEVSGQSTLDAEPLGADRFVLAYGGEDIAVGDRGVVRTAEAGPAGIGPAQTVSEPGRSAFLADLETGLRGEAVVMWGATSGDPVRDDYDLMAAARAPGVSSFSAPELVTRPGEIGITDLAIDPASGRVVATFGGDGPSRVVTRPPISP